MEKKNAQDYLDGQVLLIDKPLEWTSFQVVNKLRWQLRKTFNLKKIKVGHAGTLDPLATGLLIICTGKMTKQINTFQEQIKAYTGTLKLGSTTPSYDLETEIDQRFTTDHITNNVIHETINEFRGEIDQFPPVFSALKKQGKRFYEFARAGEKVEINSRKVTIHNFEILNIKNKTVNFSVTCSKGTYIRSLAHDFGKALKSGAHLTGLRRTKIGSFSIENATSIEDFISTLS
ncbi:MAG: tRNA pseudouridine(55) synthase TruB [Flavobacteriaceae bacterium]|nr:tRNA pseudouridine(55) synthase TruB [Flavobacteriaceae bacterium]